MCFHVMKSSVIIPCVHAQQALANNAMITAGVLYVYFKMVWKSICQIITAGVSFAYVNMLWKPICHKRGKEHKKNPQETE